MIAPAILPALLPLTALALRLGPVDFSEPLWLFALLTFIPIIYFWKTSRVPAAKFTRAITLALRSLLILALVWVLAGARVVWMSKGICVVFVLDQSQSVPSTARDIVRERMRAEIQKMTKDDRFVVVEFGGDAVLGSLPSAKGNLPPPAKVADPGRTDIARALRLAMASFPSDRQKRIVLFSDGNQNSGDALREARIAAAKNVDVDVLMLTAPQGHEVMVEQVAVPPHIRQDAHFVVRAIISSDTPQDAQLLVSRDSVPQEPLHTHLKAGTNVIDLPDQLSDGGYHEYQVTVIPDNPEGDTFAANNTGYAFTQVDAPGKILLVRGDESASSELYDALRSTGVPVTISSIGGMPSSVKDFVPYDCVVMDNVSATELAQAQMTELQRWVRDFGGGLVLIGGDHSFGAGGYKDTPLEELSPVEMDVKRQKNLASLAVVIVNDKSGSMGMPAGTNLEKMDLANEGSCQVIKLLDATDYAMIGAVDTEVKWMWNGAWGTSARLLPMTPANKAAISALTRTVVAGGGGIYCETALEHAYELLNESHIDAMAKHVIMFADVTDSEQQENCIDMARQNYARHAITTSVIGMGTKADVDARFQQEVAAAGHGRWEVSNDAMALPRLFAKEAFLIARRAFVESKTGITPTLYTSPILEGFMTSGVPKIYGYVGSTLKPRATLAMHGLEPSDPVLAHWSIGLGKCVAYTSDAHPRWGRDWVSWNGYAKFWAQVVRWVSHTPSVNGLATTTVIEGADGRVVVDAADSTGRPLNNLQLKANIIAPDDSTPSKETPLEQIGPGRYQGHFAASSRGTYLVTIADDKSSQPLATSGGVLSYPPEYRDLKPNAPLLQALADASGGDYLTNIDTVFQPKPDAVSTFWPLGEPLLIFLACALLADVAWRRLKIGDWFSRRTVRAMPVVMPAASSAGSLSAFRTIKSTRRDVDNQRETLRDRPYTAPTQSVADAPSTASTPITQTAPPEAETGEKYTSRLMSAKRRAAEQIREQSEQPPE